MLFGQLVCYGCNRILTYPLGAITCRCRLCNTVNAAQNMQVTCGACGQELHAPINTLSLLCPCCGTVTDIPEELLPPLPSCVNLGDGTEEMETAMYVSHPTLPPLASSSPPAVAGTAAAAGAREDPASTHNSAEHAEATEHRASREMQQREDAEGGDEETEEHTPPAPAVQARAAPLRLAPTVMIATRIL